MRKPKTGGRWCFSSTKLLNILFFLSSLSTTVALAPPLHLAILKALGTKGRLTTNKRANGDAEYPGVFLNDWDATARGTRTLFQRLSQAPFNTDGNHPGPRGSLLKRFSSSNPMGGYLEQMSRMSSPPTNTHNTNSGNTNTPPQQQEATKTNPFDRVRSRFLDSPEKATTQSILDTSRSLSPQQTFSSSSSSRRSAARGTSLDSSSRTTSGRSGARGTTTPPPPMATTSPHLPYSSLATSPRGTAATPLSSGGGDLKSIMTRGTASSLSDAIASKQQHKEVQPPPPAPPGPSSPPPPAPNNAFGHHDTSVRSTAAAAGRPSFPDTTSAGTGTATTGVETRGASRGGVLPTTTTDRSTTKAAAGRPAFPATTGSVGTTSELDTGRATLSRGPATPHGSTQAAGRPSFPAMTSGSDTPVPPGVDAIGATTSRGASFTKSKDWPPPASSASSPWGSRPIVPPTTSDTPVPPDIGATSRGGGVTFTTKSNEWPPPASSPWGSRPTVPEMVDRSGTDTSTGAAAGMAASRGEVGSNTASDTTAWPPPAPSHLGSTSSSSYETSKRGIPDPSWYTSHPSGAPPATAAAPGASGGRQDATTPIDQWVPAPLATPTGGTATTTTANQSPPPLKGATGASKTPPATAAERTGSSYLDTMSSLAQGAAQAAGGAFQNILKSGSSSSSSSGAALGVGGGVTTTSGGFGIPPKKDEPASPSFGGSRGGGFGAGIPAKKDSSSPSFPETQSDAATGAGGGFTSGGFGVGIPPKKDQQSSPSFGGSPGVGGGFGAGIPAKKDDATSPTSSAFPDVSSESVNSSDSNWFSSSPSDVPVPSMAPPHMSASTGLPASDLFATSSPAESVATKRPDSSWFTSSPSDAPSPSAIGGGYTNSINTPVTAASRPKRNSPWGEPDPSWLSPSPPDVPANVPPGRGSNLFSSSSPAESSVATKRPDPSWFSSNPSDAPSPSVIGGEYSNSINIPVTTASRPNMNSAWGEPDPSWLSPSPPDAPEYIGGGDNMHPFENVPAKAPAGSNLFATSSPAESVATKRPDPSWFSSNPSDAPSPSVIGGEYTNSINIPVTTASRPKMNSPWGEPDPSWLSPSPPDAPEYIGGGDNMNPFDNVPAKAPADSNLFATSSPAESVATKRPDSSWFTSHPSDAPSPSATGGEYTNSINIPVTTASGPNMNSVSNPPDPSWLPPSPPDASSLGVSSAQMMTDDGRFDNTSDRPGSNLSPTSSPAKSAAKKPPDSSWFSSSPAPSPPAANSINEPVTSASGPNMSSASNPPDPSRLPPSPPDDGPFDNTSERAGSKLFPTSSPGKSKTNKRLDPSWFSSSPSDAPSPPAANSINEPVQPPPPSNLGELAAPKSPKLDAALLGAARNPLLGEKKESLSGSTWESGDLWAETRLGLVDLWVLPRDMSNGADSRYAAAASRQELKLLQLTPQLLRLEPSRVLAAARVVLDAGFPPALLRNEPTLLTFTPEQIQRGLQELGDLSEAKQMPELLVSVIQECIQQNTVQRGTGDGDNSKYKRKTW